METTVQGLTPAMIERLSRLHDVKSIMDEFPDAYEFNSNGAWDKDFEYFSADEVDDWLGQWEETIELLLEYFKVTSRERIIPA